MKKSAASPIEVLNHAVSMHDSCSPIFNYIDRHFNTFIETLIRICEVPASTFSEKNRADFVSRLFREAGMTPQYDKAGNVHVPILQNGSPHLVVSAHLDTVFHFDRIQVTRNGSLLQAPGISDDCAGLSALLLLARAIKECALPLNGSMTIVCTVGEEGLGNLRGARFLFGSEQPAGKIDIFVSLDGADPERVIIAGLASKRLRIILHGPGGHSWGDAGTANPIQVAGEFLQRLNRIQLSTAPKTTLNVGIIQGGTSVNAIPTEVSMDIDLRSETAEHVDALELTIDEHLSNTIERLETIRCEKILLGERPAGSITSDHPLARTIAECNSRFGISTTFESASTDSNIPLAAGIPALTLGVGGKSGKIHTPDEWYDPAGGEAGLKRLALLITGLLNGAFNLGPPISISSS